MGCPGFSIIIPISSDDFWEPLKGCLRSIRWQSYERYFVEVLVVCTWVGKSDRILTHTRGVASCYGASVIEADCPSPMLNFSFARNYGARRSRRHLLAFIDADIVLDPDTLSVAFRFLQDFHVVSANFVTMSEPPDHPMYDGCADPWIFRTFAHRALLNEKGFGACTFARRDTFEEMHGYDEEYWGWAGEDDDFIGRVRRHEGLRWANMTTEVGLRAMHQHHEKRMQSEEEIAQTAKNWMRLRKSEDGLLPLHRNFDGWGGMP